MTQNEYAQWLFEAIEKYNGVTKAQILSSTRKKEIAEARHVFVYMMRQKTLISLQDLSALTGRNDHTTSMHSLKVVQNALETDYHPIVNLAQHLNDTKLDVVNDVKKQVAQEIWTEINSIFVKYGINYGS